MKVTMIVIVLMLLTLLFVGCQTVGGLGRDLGWCGDGLSKMAERASE